MKILSIETSCDETAVSVLEGNGPELKVLGNALSSQAELHAKYGGVFPSLAKRAHAEKIVPLLKEALEQAEKLKEVQSYKVIKSKDELQKLFSHEQGLAEQIVSFAEQYETPNVDCIAVTSGPGLEPALWVGINTATALGKLWDKPVYPINHMEGHFLASVMQENVSSKVKSYEMADIKYPALGLLVSGGHTELVLSDKPLSYKKIGQTKDDAVGEAFDKVARMLGLPYPGGPQISALALEARTSGLKSDFPLPRPMLHSQDYDFSYSGLKTAVLYAIKDKKLTEEQRKFVAREFEEAAIEVLVEKTRRAVEEYSVQTLIVGGGVAANNYLREQLLEKIPVPILFPTYDLSTDNSIMIGMALYYQMLHSQKEKTVNLIKADGNLSI